jgi:hypothetical protein
MTNAKGRNPVARLFSDFPYHTAVLPVSFAFAIFVDNRFLVEVDDFLKVAFWMILGAVALVSVLRPLFGTWRRAAIAGTAITAFLLFQPTLVSALEPERPVTIGMLLLSFSALLLLLLSLWRSSSSMSGLTLSLNIAVLAMLLPGILQLSLGLITNRSVAAPADEVFPKSPVPIVDTVTSRPDIWYLVPDRYSNLSVLKSYGFDNSAFVDFLRDRRFTVIENAHSNYQRTALSVTAVLNLEYLDRFDAYEDEMNGRDWRPLYRALRNNRVSRILAQSGYEIHRFGSHWEPTRRDPYADKHHNIYDMPEFALQILKVTVFGELAYATSFGVFDHWYSHCRRTQKQFDELLALTDSEELKYVFAHLLIPHPPFVMDSTGRCLSKPQAVAQGSLNGYLASLAVANDQLKRLIDAILAGPRPAVIVLMADEGPLVGGVRRLQSSTLSLGEWFDWTSMTAQQLDKRTGILMSIYVPEDTEFGRPVPGSPVNVFRMIFRQYLDLDLPALPDRYYISASDDDIYSFIDVTDRLPRQTGRGPRQN